MAFRNVAVPWLSGGVAVLGYAAFSWLRAKRTQRGRSELRIGLRNEAVEPLVERLERVSGEVVLGVESEQLPANSNAQARAADLGARFLGRAGAALSPFHFGPEWPEVRR